MFLHKKKFVLMIYHHMNNHVAVGTSPIQEGQKDMKLTVILYVGVIGFLQISQARVASLPLVPGEFTAGN